MSCPFALRPACGGMGAAMFALAMLLGAGTGMAREIAGSLSYPERIALPEDAEIMVEARDFAGRVVADVRLPTEGRQLPFDFVLSGAPEMPLTVFAAVFAGGQALRMTDQVAVASGHADVALGNLRLHPHLPMGFATTLRCGTLRLQLGYLGDEARLRVGHETYRLRPDSATSDARYVSDADPGTWVRTRDNRATVSLAGRQLPECLPTTDAAFLPLTAKEAAIGEGWTLLLDRAAMEVRQAGRVLVSEPTPPAVPVEGPLGEIAGYRYSGMGLDLTVLDRPCSLPGGVPHPLAVMLQIGGRLHEGCGGDPMALLAGEAWRIVALDGAEVAAARGLSIGFGDGRVFGNSGCNRYSGGLVVSSATLAIGSIAATRMACAPDRMEIESRFHRLLGRVAGFTLGADGTLELRDAAGAVLIVAQR